MLENFLTNTDETGRFIVTSQRTGRKYYVEPIGDGRPADWGSVNPATGEMMHKKGDGKFSGSITEAESLITPEFFKEIHTLSKGVSPLAFIEQLDKKYQNG